jgi:hypothetical protein
MFPGEGDVEDRQVVRDTTHANNQHFREQYTPQANKDRPEPGLPTYQTKRSVALYTNAQTGTQSYSHNGRKGSS